MYGYVRFLLTRKIPFQLQPLNIFFLDISKPSVLWTSKNIQINAH